MDRTLRILLVDDNPGDRALATLELQREFPQLQVQEIKESLSFERSLAAGEFDLVITDYQLRWSNGLEVLRTIKKRYPSCPVIMFTNTGSEEIAVEAVRSGLDDYVLKRPNRYVRLTTAVRVALERAENKRRAALLDLRLQGLLNQLKVGVFRSNSEGILLECNPAFLDLLGLDSIERSRSTQPLNLRECYLRLTSQPLPQRQEREIQLRRADGTLIWTLLNITLNSIEDEAVVDGLIEDITARKQIEAELQQLNKTLEQRVRERTAQLEAANQELEATNQKLEVANQDLEAFGYSVSHDLREPLRVIQGLALALLNQEGERSPLFDRDYIQRIFESTQQADRLIQDLLSYSQLSRAEMPLQPINLTSVAVEVLAQLEPQLQQQQARVNVEEPLAEVTGNRRILVQVFTNLLSNAIKFVEPGLQSQVRIGTEERNEWVRLWVQDNGIGIPKEAQKRIFNVFERLHGSEIYPGSGIGLAIVRKGVERMGGQVGVESQFGQGSRFWIDLPTVKEEY